MASPNHNTHFIVENIDGTSHLKARQVCGCKDWTTHWRKHTGSRRTTCMVLGCSRPVEVGAHVRLIDGRRTDAPHIAGLCKGHNHPTQTLEMALDARSALIEAAYIDGCGR